MITLIQPTQVELHIVHLYLHISLLQAYCTAVYFSFVCL